MKTMNRRTTGAALALASIAALGVGATSASAEGAPAAGIDVSSHQGNVDWGSHKANGVTFAYAKATEGTDYLNPFFGQQYNGSAEAGMVRGAYHFARPDVSGGAAQADYFVDNGGGWSNDGKTLPGALDMEANPYGDTCYGLDAGQMEQWVADFTARYKERTGRDAVIYTSRSWWKECAGNSPRFAQTNPLWVASYIDGDNPGELPGGWATYTIWQKAEEPIDTNVFNGDQGRVEALAKG